MVVKKELLPTDIPLSKLTSKKNRHLIHISTFILIVSSITSIFADVTADFVNNPWNDKLGANTPRSVRISNNTPDVQDVKGVRFSVPENTAMNTGVMDGSTKLKADDPWNGDRRYDVRIKYSIKAGATSGATVKGGGVTEKTDWTPYDAQMLVKTRSFADMADFVDANPVTIEQIDSIIAEPEFYDDELYVSDTLGENAPLFGAGFIDTYIKQKDSTPITQVQMNEFDEDLYIKLSIGYNVKYRPDLMGENDKVPGKNNGPGPLYCMGLVAAQELMHIDQQFLAPMGIIETQAGFESYGVMGDGSIGARIGMTHIQKNDYAIGMGPMHMEGTGFAEKAYASYPTFFPYANGGNPSQWFTTPGTETSGNDLGACTGNSAQIVNATMLATLYCWRGYEQLFRATDFYAKGIFEEAADRALAAKLYMWGWNAGFSSSKGGTYSGPLYWDDIKDIADITPRISGKTNYVPKVMPAVNGILEAQKNSVLNGGTSKVIDMPISLEYIAEFFYGNDTPPYTSSSFAEQGDLGKGGILQHFELTQEQRKQLWSDLKAAFNKMKGQAPSGYSDAVSLRYDWLTLLRIAKGYIYPQMFDVPFKPVMLPTPTDRIFNTWVNTHSTENNIPDIPEKDTTFPNLKVQNLDVADNGDFIVELRGGDNVAIDIEDPLTAEWCIDAEWRRWMPGEYVSGTKTDANFRLTIPVDLIKDKFGDNDGRGWVRITDKSGNSTIDTITIGGIPYPKVDSVFITDLVGDGIGRTIDVYLTKGGSDEADELADWQKIEYSWPGQSSFITAAREKVDLNGSVLTITDNDLTDGAGLGMLNLSYPSKQDYGDEIQDRVGPALINKANLYCSENSSKPDTLAVKFSEIVEGIKTSGLQLGFSEDKSDSTGEAHVDVITINEDSVRFLFDADKLPNKSYKWVKIEIDGGITDKAPAKNKPLDKNQWIPIVDNRAKYPTLDSAIVFDTDGNGTADSIAISLTRSNSADAFGLDAFTELLYVWPGSPADEKVTVTKLDDNTLRFGDLKNDDGAGLGEISVLYEEMSEAVTTDILDRVGPVITSATLSIEDDSRDKDTLLITVSEELANYDVKDNFYTFLKKGNDEKEERSERVLRVEATTYKVVYDRDLVIDKDSVKFTTGGGITDKVNNTPMEINQRVKITKIGGKEPLISLAEIFDIDGDGRGDSVYVALTLGSAADKYTTGDIENGKYSWPGTSLDKDLTPDDLENSTENSFGFYYDSKATSGTGRIELNFPEGYTTPKDIEDKVGPVIDSAICLQIDSDREKDTLVLKVSEKLKENFIDNTKYLILFENKDDNEGDTITVSTISEKDGNYIFTVAKGAVTYGDWIQFNYDAGIKDMADNSPLSINQKVLINVKGSIAPTITSAEIFDTRGDKDRLDGNGDSIFVDLSLTDDPMALTVDSIESVEYSWNGTTKSKERVELFRISESRFAIIDESLTGGAGSGTVKISFIKEYEVSGTIDDKIAPVLNKAKYYNWDGAEDTLHVTFSEELFSTGSSTPLFKSGDKKLTLKEVSHSGAKVTYAVEGSESISYGDSIWICADEDIIDEKSNEQADDNNRRIPVSYVRVTALEKATYFDTDSRPDGYIDEIHLSFAGNLDESVGTLLKREILLPSVRELTIDDVEIDGENVKLYVKQAKEKVSVNTAVSAADTLSLPYSEGDDTLALYSKEAIIVADAMAPIIISARFSPAKVKEDGKLIDTLRLSYSEAVKRVTTDEPFTFSDGDNDNDEYTLPFEGNNRGKDGVNYYCVYDRSNVLPGSGDSIWIDELGEVTDEHGNEQERNSVAVPLTVGKYPPDYEVSIAPIPFDIKNYGDSTINFYILPGTRTLPADISATAVIYDKVGNVIKKIDASDFGEVEAEQLIYEFTPKNEQDRKLGEGSYPVILIVTANGEATRFDRMLGIRGELPGESTEDDEKDEEK